MTLIRIAVLVALPWLCCLGKPPIPLPTSNMTPRIHKAVVKAQRDLDIPSNGLTQRPLRVFNLPTVPSLDQDVSHSYLENKETKWNVELATLLPGITIFRKRTRWCVGRTSRFGSLMATWSSRSWRFSFPGPISFSYKIKVVAVPSRPCDGNWSLFAITSSWRIGITCFWSPRACCRSAPGWISKWRNPFERSLVVRSIHDGNFV
jgi:hypothetical protein